MLQQVNFSFEILIHDDASTDGTDVIIKEYHAKYPECIKPIFQSENQYSKGVRGMMLRFNFPRARGKYIALCEGDDYWTDPSKLQKQVDFLEANEDFSVCFHDAMLARDGMEQRKYVNQNKQVFTTEDLFGRHFIPTASIVYRSGGVEFPEWLKYVSSGDIALLLILSLEGKMHLINEVMSTYRLHPQGVSNTHIGMTKVFGIAKLMTYFDAHTNGAYSVYCQKALKYEFETHVSKIEVDYSKLSNFSSKSLFRELCQRLVLKVRGALGFGSIKGSGKL